MIPGSDLLGLALTVINTSSLLYFKANGRTVNTIGTYVTSYDDPVEIQGSLQPVPRKFMHEHGLDLSKVYFQLYVEKNIIDVQRNVSSDKVQFGNREFQCLSANDWFPIDGWLSILCVLVLGQAS